MDNTCWLKNCPLQTWLHKFENVRVFMCQVGSRTGAPLPILIGCCVFSYECSHITIMWCCWYIMLPKKHRMLAAISINRLALASYLTLESVSINVLVLEKNRWVCKNSLQWTGSKDCDSHSHLYWLCVCWLCVYYSKWSWWCSSSVIMSLLILSHMTFDSMS
jgi:hypothetical protein